MKSILVIVLMFFLFSWKNAKIAAALAGSAAGTGGGARGGELKSAAHDSEIDMSSLALVLPTIHDLSSPTVSTASTSHGSFPPSPASPSPASPLSPIRLDNNPVVLDSVINEFAKAMTPDGKRESSCELTKMLGKRHRLYAAIESRNVAAVKSEVEQGWRDNTKYSEKIYDRQSKEKGQPFWYAFFETLREQNPVARAKLFEILGLLAAPSIATLPERTISASGRRCAQGGGPLHHAAHADDAAMIRFLIENNIFRINDVNSCGRTALFFARGREVTQLLLFYNIDVNRVAYNSKSGPIYVAHCVPPQVLAEIIQVKGYKGPSCCCSSCSCSCSCPGVFLSCAIL